MRWEKGHGYEMEDGRWCSEMLFSARGRENAARDRVPRMQVRGLFRLGCRVWEMEDGIWEMGDGLGVLREVVWYKREGGCSARLCAEDAGA